MQLQDKKKFVGIEQGSAQRGDVVLADDTLGFVELPLVRLQLRGVDFCAIATRKPVHKTNP